MDKWHVDWSNEADRGYELIMDFIDNDAYRARLELNSSDELVLTVYRCDKNVQIPAALLADAIAGALPALLESRKLVQERDRDR